MMNVVLALMLTFTFFTPHFSQATETKPESIGTKSETQCKLKFELETWSIFYKTGKGQGKVTCENGQSAEVGIQTVGGGLTFGKTKITDGSGTFSKVEDISEVYGAYASSEAHAGAVKSGQVQAMTKGTVSLVLSGKGKGFDLGIAFGKFKIVPWDEMNSKSKMKERDLLGE